MFTTLRHWARQALLPRMTVGHVAATLLILASGLANVRYGLMLGQTTLEKVIAVGASIGADLWSGIGFLAAAAAFARAEYVKGSLASVVLTITLTYATVAGIGFASQTRSEVVGHEKAIARSDKLAEHELKSLEDKLAKLLPTRPVAELQSEIDRIVSDKRTNSCSSVDGPVSRKECPRYFELKAELGRALESSKLDARREELTLILRSASHVSDGDALTNSLTAYLSSLGITANAEAIQPWLALLFVLLVVLGGPVALWVSERQPQQPEPQPKEPDMKPEPEGKSRASNSRPAENDNRPTTANRRRGTLTPAAHLALDKIVRLGGMVSGRTQSDIANTLGVPRTTLKRIVQRLETANFVTTGHDANGYRIKVAA